MKIYFVVNARMPNSKAYGIHIAKMCEAFVKQGADVELVIPRTHASRTSVQEFFGLEKDIKTKVLFGVDWYAGGRPLFFASSLIFMASSLLYLRSKRGSRSVVYTVDMDTFSFTLLPLSGLPVVAEMHTPKPHNFLTSFFFRRVHVIATQSEIASALEKTFAIPEGRLLIEPNGVDLAAFGRSISKQEARQALRLPQDKKIVLYVGRFYGWKSLSILAEVARLSPEVYWQVVGGSAEEFKKVSGSHATPPSLHFAGLKPLKEVPMWIAAADAVLVLGSKENETSYRYTAPMKVFEYMAAGRPVVTSATPALKSFVREEDVFWYEPDNAKSLGEAVAKALQTEDPEQLNRTLLEAQKHTWDARTGRIYGWVTDMLKSVYD